MTSDISPCPAGTNHNVIGGQMTQSHENDPVPASKCIDKCVCASYKVKMRTKTNFYSKYGLQ